MIDEVMEMAQGNPGALQCIMDILNNDIDTSVAGLTILPKIKKLDIRGTDLYVFWSDLCNKDYQKMALLCDQCPEGILKDACSRQDYSGIQLVKEYID